MLKDSKAYSGFSVPDTQAAKTFYAETLGLEVDDTPMGLIIKLGGVTPVFVYQKSNHEPATFTILNFPVDDIDRAVTDLKAKGITFEHYDNLTDEQGIARGLSRNQGPDIAWFKDPAGNILSVLQEA